MNIEKIGAICKDYRTRVLGISLINFAKLNNEKPQNIHAFEQGKLNHVKYLCMYMKQSNINQLKVLYNKLFNLGVDELFKDIPKTI